MEAEPILEHVEIMLAHGRVDREIVKDFPGPCLGNEVNSVRCCERRTLEPAFRVHKAYPRGKPSARFSGTHLKPHVTTVMCLKVTLHGK